MPMRCMADEGDCRVAGFPGNPKPVTGMLISLGGAQEDIRQNLMALGEGENKDRHNLKVFNLPSQ